MVDAGMGDDALVAAAVAGDSQAFAQIFDRYAPRIHAFCRRTLGDDHTAADATQDTFVTAARRLSQLRDPSKLRPWLYAVARNECTRHGRARDRYQLVDDVAVTTDRDADAFDDRPAAEAAAGETAALLWEAASGLDERDRTLLDLQVRHGLDGQELALAAGIAPGQISMATGRLRDRVERAVGALLVARHGRADCPDLQSVLAGWDGTFSVLMRKRVARHVDGCDRCQRRRTALVAPFGSLAMAPLAVVFSLDDLPAGLRRATLDRVAADGGVAPGSTGADDGWVDGFPPVTPLDADADDGDEDAGDDAPPPRSRARRLAPLVTAAVLLGAVVGVGALAAGDDPGPDEQVAVTAPPTTPSETDEAGSPDDPDDPDPSPAGPTASTPADGTPVPTTAPPLVDGTTRPEGPAGPTPTTGPAVVPGPSETPPATTPPPAPNRPPVVGAPQRSGSGDLQTSCNPANATRTVTATVTDDGTVTAVVLRWQHSDGTRGQRAMTRSGPTYRATLGPFTTPGSVTYRVVATDDDGATTSSPVATVGVDPCPG